MWLHRLADADASCGGKAVGLARLIAAGLPVPDGFVLDDRAFRHVAGDLDPASDAIGHALFEAGQRILHAELPADLMHAAALAPRASEVFVPGPAETRAALDAAYRRYQALFARHAGE